jgi:hypothetical protein
MKKLIRRPSPAMIVAIVALIVALGGTALAGGVLNKKKAKTIANSVVTQRASGLSVASAKNADNANNAKVAQSPVAWAHIAANGDVIASSSNISQANEDNPYSDGEYCFKGLGFAFKSMQATVDASLATDNIVAQVAIPDPLDCNFGTGFSGLAQAGVVTNDANTGTTLVSAGFFVWFFN